ncbi:MAG: hypothetical protein ACTSQ7_09395 [Alphaproteobacteria bacterium]
MTDIRAGVPLSAFEALRRWHQRRQANAKRRRAIAELDGLDDRILQDIGVNRRSIRDLVDAQLQAEAEAAEPRRSFGARPCAQPC